MRFGPYHGVEVPYFLCKERRGSVRPRVANVELLAVGSEPFILGSDADESHAQEEEEE